MSHANKICVEHILKNQGEEHAQVLKYPTYLKQANFIKQILVKIMSLYIKIAFLSGFLQNCF